MPKPPLKPANQTGLRGQIRPANILPSLHRGTSTKLLRVYTISMEKLEKRYRVKDSNTHSFMYIIRLGLEESKVCSHSFSCWASKAQRSERSYCYCDFTLHVSQCQLLQPTMMSWLLNVSTAHYFMRLNALHRSLAPAHSLSIQPLII